jgi:hypothetical protein
LDFRARRRRECQRQESEALVATITNHRTFSFYSVPRSVSTRNSGTSLLDGFPQDPLQTRSSSNGLFNSKPPGGGSRIFPRRYNPVPPSSVNFADLYLTFLDLSRLQPTFDDPQAIQVDVLSLIRRSGFVEH